MKSPEVKVKGEPAAGVACPTCGEMTDDIGACECLPEGCTWCASNDLGRILEWLREHHDGASFEVTELVEVHPFGDDYAGSTEDGHYPTFRVTLIYRTTDPSRPTLHLNVEGSDMESLWRHVVGGDQ